MSLIKLSPKTPKQRWQQKVILTKVKIKYKYFYYKYKTNHKSTLLGAKAIHGVRRFNKTLSYFITGFKLNLIPRFVFTIDSHNKPLKEIAWTKTIFNQIFLTHNTELTYPGFKFYPVNKLISSNLKYANQVVPLYCITINTPLSFLFNCLNNYPIYSRSSGSNAIKNKFVKKQKLTYVQLPSGKIKLFSINTYCIYSTTNNLFINKIIEGGWSFSKTNKKTINVRGVAKNPVDHPNGGRTKAKQPELSPWGWVAKKNK